jgi:hypothetical protein
MVLVQRFEFAPEAADQVEEGTGDTNVHSKSVEVLRSDLNLTPGILLSQKAVAAVSFSLNHSISQKQTKGKSNLASVNGDGLESVLVSDLCRWQVAVRRDKLQEPVKYPILWQTSYSRPGKIQSHVQSGYES